LYALPLLHNLDHRADHTHANAAHSHSSASEHVHPHPPASTTPDPQGREPLDPEHGEGSLLHFAAVVVGEEPTVLPELVYTVLSVATEPVPTIDTPALLAFLARGPPA
jgi:hypothetical protein